MVHDALQRQEVSALTSALFKGLAAGEADVLPPPTAEELTTFQGMFASMTGGWTGSFEVLEAFLAS